MHDGHVLRLRISLKGRPVRSYRFDQDCVVIGRDPGADVVLDNPGISRRHARIVRSPVGFVVEDLGSANGTYVNEAPVTRQPLAEDDMIGIGKFSLWVGLESPENEEKPAPAAVEGTTVLTSEQLQRILASMRKSEAAPPEKRRAASHTPAGAGAAPARRGRLLVAVGLAFAAGVAVGTAGAILGVGLFPY